jgi:hypothetical protein
MPKSWVVRIPVTVTLMVVLAMGAWCFTYPGPDPKSVKYVMWKAGLYKMDPDLAVSIMVGDPGRDKLVVGKTKEQLRKRFGQLLTLGQVSQYYKDGYDRSWSGKDVLFIKNSAWMVVFDQDTATNLVLMKGY